MFYVSTQPTEEVVAITENVLKQLKQLQEDDNACLQSYRELLSESIATMALAISDKSPTHPDTINVVRIITELAWLRDNLKNFEKPT